MNPKVIKLIEDLKKAMKMTKEESIKSADEVVDEIVEDIKDSDDQADVPKEDLNVQSNKVLHKVKKSLKIQKFVGKSKAKKVQKQGIVMAKKEDYTPEDVAKIILDKVKEIYAQSKLEKKATEEMDIDLKKPYVSEAQRGYMHAAADRGEIPKKVVDEFDAASKGQKNLPKHVKKDELNEDANEVEETDVDLKKDITAAQRQTTGAASRVKRRSPMKLQMFVQGNKAKKMKKNLQKEEKQG